MFLQVDEWIKIAEKLKDNSEVTVDGELYPDGVNTVPINMNSYWETVVKHIRKDNDMYEVKEVLHTPQLEID